MQAALAPPPLPAARAVSALASRPRSLMGHTIARLFRVWHAEEIRALDAAETAVAGALVGVGVRDVPAVLDELALDAAIQTAREAAAALGRSRAAKWVARRHREWWRRAGLGLAVEENMSFGTLYAEQAERAVERLAPLVKEHGPLPTPRDVLDVVYAPDAPSELALAVMHAFRTLPAMLGVGATLSRPELRPLAYKLSECFRDGARAGLVLLAVAPEAEVPEDVLPSELRLDPAALDARVAARNREFDSLPVADTISDADL